MFWKDSSTLVILPLEEVASANAVSEESLIGVRLVMTFFMLRGVSPVLGKQEGVVDLQKGEEED